MLGITTQKHSPAVTQTVREEKEKDYMLDCMMVCADIIHHDQTTSELILVSLQAWSL